MNAECQEDEVFVDLTSAENLDGDLAPVDCRADMWCAEWAMPTCHLPLPSVAAPCRGCDEVASQVETSRREFLGQLAKGGGALAVAPVLWKQPGASGAVPLAPRVGWGADPRRSLTVSWATDRHVRAPVLEVGTDDGLGLVLPAETHVVAGWGVNYHRATIDGLAPDTAYRYRCRHVGAASPIQQVRTAPDRAERLTFAAYGDQGSGDRATAIAGVLAVAEPAFTFCLGDLCYADTSGGVLPQVRVDHAVWDTWLAMLSSATADRAALLPVVGNHEIETGMGDGGYDGFLTRLARPATGAPGLPTTWSGRWGNVALVALDANDVSTEITRNNGVSGGHQDDWLAATLEALRRDPTIDWIVAGFHHCAYCTNAVHGSDAGVRRWAPLFDRYHVDLVLNGHNHCYERTHPIRAGELAGEVRSGGDWDPVRGVTYLCAGGGGQTGYPLSTPMASTVTVDGGTRVPEPAPWSAFTYNDNSLVLIDVTPPDSIGATTLMIRAVTAAGAELERITLRRLHH